MIRLIKKAWNFSRIALYRIKVFHMIIASKYKGIKLLIGKSVSLFQTTIISGKGSVKIGNNVTFGYKMGGNYYKNAIEIQPRYKESLIEIGENTAFNNNVFICCAGRIVIDNDCRIGEGVTIYDFEAHGTSPDKRNEIGEIKEIYIGSNVWIGSKAIILKGSKIGNNSIIAAGAVVTGKEFPENVIIGGNPAKVIKYI